MDLMRDVWIQQQQKSFIKLLSGWRSMKFLFQGNLQWRKRSTSKSLRETHWIPTDLHRTRDQRRAHRWFLFPKWLTELLLSGPAERPWWDSITLCTEPNPGMNNMSIRKSVAKLPLKCVLCFLEVYLSISGHTVNICWVLLCVSWMLHHSWQSNIQWRDDASSFFYVLG